MFYPLLVAETVEVSIWFIDHLILRFLPDVRLVAILRTRWDMSNGILHVIRIDKLLLQFFPLWGIRLQRERMCQEIVRSRILIHTSHQIRDGIQEMLLLHHWRIKYHVVAQLSLSSPYMVGHTLQHLETEAILRRLVHLCQQIRIRDSEQVV